MNKLVYSTVLLLAVTNLNAQENTNGFFTARSNEYLESKVNQQGETTIEKSTEIWSSSFGTPAEWVISHDVVDCSLDWQIGIIPCSGSFPIPTIQSTTASDGWAMIDSDKYGNDFGGAELEDSWLTMANSVDLLSFPNVVVEFETQYRRYNYEKPYIVVGFGDGTGLASVTWPDLNPMTDISSMPNVFEVFPTFADNESTDNSEKIQINISQALVGMSSLELQNVYIRIQWTGTWGYAWFVDDFRIVEQANDDLQTKKAWIIGEKNEGIQYGRIPDTQLDANWIIGANVLNFGVNDQTNLDFTADFTSFSFSDNSALLKADSTVIFENLQAVALSSGVYTGTYSVVSSEEFAGPDFSNNSIQRVFEVTTSPQMVYSLDGIDLHPPADQKVAYIGTDSYLQHVPSSVDGLTLASMYQFQNSAQVSGLRILLANGSELGGELTASIKDTNTFLHGNMTSLAASQPAFISATNLSNGYIDVFFNNEVSLDSGAYYAAVTLYSHDSVSHVRVVDDRTLEQPLYASALFIPGESTYANGTALGIRMLLGNDWGAGLDENSLSGVSIYPNPTDGILHIAGSNNLECTITVHDLSGRQILSTNATTINLSGNETGVYTVTVSNEHDTVVKRIVLK